MKRSKLVTCFRLASFRTCINCSAREAMPSAHRRTMSSFSTLASRSCIRKHHRNKCKCKQRGLVERARRLAAPAFEQYKQGKASKSWDYSLDHGENVIGTHMASSRHQNGYKKRGCSVRVSQSDHFHRREKIRRKTENRENNGKTI